MLRIERSTTVGITLRAFAIVITLLCVAVSGWASETVLHVFTATAEVDGVALFGILAMDAAGNLYGTTNGGGTFASCPSGGYCGVVYELSPVTGGGWTETVLYRTFGHFELPRPEFAGWINEQCGDVTPSENCVSVEEI